MNRGRSDVDRHAQELLPPPPQASIVDQETAAHTIYVLRANTVSQMENFLMDVFGHEPREGVSIADNPYDDE